ncbi:MAG: tripartite tricarboxylate transporter TctB family protein [Betaproteobacteria bacterium]
MPATAFPVSPRTDLRTGFFWIALGAVLVFASWRMDRMQQQGALLYTAPGLWPGVIGLLIAMLGGILVWRSVRRAHAIGWAARNAVDTVLVPASRFALAAAMFFVYSLLLVGRGLPFWLGTGLFVTVFIFVFRRADQASGAGAGTPRGDAILALTCGVVTAIVIPLLFEQLFYVRLP